MKNVYFIIIAFFVSNYLSSQSIKKFTGEFTNDGKYGQHGIVEFSYFEDSITREYVKHGKFKYTFNGIGEYKGFIQSISGQFEKGLKVGKWTYTINKLDYKENGENKYYTGIVSLISNYKDGYANGNWNYYSNLKYRSQIIKYPGYVWSEYKNLGLDTINVNFKNNLIVSSLHINDKYSNYKADVFFDTNGYCDSSWHIIDNSLDLIRDIKFKKGFKVESVNRHLSDFSVEKAENNYTYFDRLNYYNSLDIINAERQKCSIDTISTIGSEIYFYEYFKRLLNNDNFIYSSIGGDLSFRDKFNGCYEVHFKEFASLKDIEGFLENYNNYYTEDTAYAIFKLTKKNIDDFMPSDRNIINNFIKKMTNVNRLGNLKNFNSFRFQNDSLGMYLTWNRGNIRYDQLSKDDKYIVDNLIKLFKDTFSNSLKFSKNLDLVTRDLFQTYSKFLIKNNIYDPFESKTSTKYECFYSDKLFKKEVYQNDFSNGYILIPNTDSIFFMSNLNSCTLDTSVYKVSFVEIIKSYFNIYKSINRIYNSTPQVSITFSKSEIQYKGNYDLISKYTDKFYSSLFFGDLNTSIIELKNSISEFSKLLSSVPLIIVAQSNTRW